MASRVMREWWQLRDLIADCERICKEVGDTDWLSMFEEHADHLVEIATDPTSDVIEAKAKSIATALGCDSDSALVELLEDIRQTLKERLTA